MDAVFTYFNVCEDIANKIRRDVHTLQLKEVHNELLKVLVVGGVECGGGGGGEL